MASLLGLAFLVVVVLSARAKCPDRCDCQNAQQVLCSNRGLSAVPKVPDSNPNDILILSLGGNFITNISAFDLVSFKHLLRLDLQYNRIQSIHPKAFVKLSELEELYLGNNLLSTICPGTFQPLKKLRFLYANGNSIKRLTARSITNLESVIKLRLDGNSIEALQYSLFKRRSNLLYLHLESNMIQYISENVFIKLEKLRFLNLSDNKLTNISNIFTLAQLTSLTTLLLSGNEITHVDGHVFQNLPKLSKLALDNNKVSQIESEALNGLSHVKEFVINGNLLEDIPARLLDPLQRVEELDFSHNRISNVDPSAFKQLKHLKVLKLQRNRLTTLAGHVFTSNGDLHSLDLNFNNWTCDCRIGEFKEWISRACSQGTLLTVFLQCYHPEALRGKYLDYLSHSELQVMGNHSQRCQAVPSPAVNVSTESSEALGVQEVSVQHDQGRSREMLELPIDQIKLTTGVTSLQVRIPSWEQAAGILRTSGEERTGSSRPRHTPRAPKQHGSGPSVRPGLPPVRHGEGKPGPLLEEREELPVVTDPCELNQHFILNVTAGQVTSSSATIHWAARQHSGPAVYFRVLFDRFDQRERFHRFVYIRDRAHQVTLQELREDSTYMVCVEGVVGGAVCPVASRDHCVGVVTQPAEREGGVDVQVVIKVILGVNILLMLLLGGVWIGRSFRRTLRRRKSAVRIRQMLSTRQPLCSMATTVTKDFSAYQVSQPRIRGMDEADPIMFPCDRVLSTHSSGRGDGMHQFHL